MLCYLKYENVSLDLPSKRGLENKGVKESYIQHCICFFIYLYEPKAEMQGLTPSFYIFDKAWSF